MLSVDLVMHFPCSSFVTTKICLLWFNRILKKNSWRLVFFFYLFCFVPLGKLLKNAVYQSITFKLAQQTHDVSMTLLLRHVSWDTIPVSNIIWCGLHHNQWPHLSVKASQITGNSTVCLAVCSTFLGMTGIHRWSVVYAHKRSLPSSL